MADKKRDTTAKEREATLAEALNFPGAVLMEDAIKQSKQRVSDYHEVVSAAGAIQGTTAAAPTGSTAVTGSTTGTTGGTTTT